MTLVQKKHLARVPHDMLSHLSCCAQVAQNRQAF
jgi:hypothetical protein